MARGWRGKLFRGETPRTHLDELKSVHCDWSYEWMLSWVKVFGTAWLFVGEPSGDHTVPTAAMYSGGEVEKLSGSISIKSLM